jgi:hypothetical protein
MDFWAGWMERADENVYGEFLHKAVTLASNICRTERAGWGPFDLVTYDEQWGPLNPPAQWPSYRIQRGIFVATGQKLERNGIYVPDVVSSCAEFLYIGYETAPAAKVHVGMRPLLDPTTGEQYAEEPIFENRDCTWYLVERVPDEEGGRGIILRQLRSMLRSRPVRPVPRPVFTSRLPKRNLDAYSTRAR